MTSVGAFVGFLALAVVMALSVAAPAGAQTTFKCRGVDATLVGTVGDDVLLGTAGNDVIVALGGNDEIRGLGGADLICGGPGNDKIFGLGGPDRIDGGIGNDTIQGGDGNDWLFGGTGADLILGADGKDRMFGNGGDDRLFGGPGADAINGDLGTDMVAGGLGLDNCRTPPPDTRATCERPMPADANRAYPAVNNTSDNAKGTLGIGLHVGGTKGLVYAIGFATDITATYTGKDTGSIIYNDQNTCDLSHNRRTAITPGRYTVRFAAPGFRELNVVWHVARGYVYCSAIRQVP